MSKLAYPVLALMPGAAASAVVVDDARALPSRPATASGSKRASAAADRGEPLQALHFSAGGPWT